MIIKTLFLCNFRNCKEAAISFVPKVNYIFGDNAQGKTNLLEAIYVLITGRSFRTAHLNDLIYFGSSFFYIEAHFEKNGIEQTLKFAFNEKERKIIHNATLLPSLSSLIGILNGVILSPEDRSLVKGGPQSRRQFLDLLIAQANPLYLHHLSRYHKAMRQRNILLKHKAFSTIEAWETQMALSAAYLTLGRHRATMELQKLCQLETLTSDKLQLSYRSSALTATSLEHDKLVYYFAKQLEKQRPRESEIGSTLSGPHRDDLSILLEGKEARLFASEGQQKSSIASLKLAQWKHLQMITEQTPLMCIDDVGVSLDQKREKALLTQMNELGQVFITSPRLEKDLSTNHLIRVEGGNFFL